MRLLMRERRYAEAAKRVAFGAGVVVALIVLGQWLKYASIALLGDQLEDGGAATLALILTLALTIAADRGLLRKARPEATDG